MNRRKFLVGTSASLAALGLAGYGWTKLSSATNALTIKSAISLLDSVTIERLSATGSWSLIHIFDHCAKSIQYSMSGFPEHKPDSFKTLVGKPAFELFKAYGAMSHNLSEEIPKAIYPSPSKSAQQAIERLKSTFLVFEAYSEPLHPHFAYGSLSKRDYEIAHVMHLLNHWSEIRL